MRLVELHDAPTPPGAIRRRARVGVDGDDTVAAACERRAEREPRRTGSHDDHVHGLTFHYTDGMLITLSVQSICATHLEGMRP